MLWSTCVGVCKRAPLCEIWARERAQIKQSRAPGERMSRAGMMNVGRWSRSITDPDSLHKTIQQLIVCCPLIPHVLLRLSMKICWSLTHLTSHSKRSFSSFRTEYNGTKIICAINKDSVQSSQKKISVADTDNECNYHIFDRILKINKILNT